LHSVFPAKAVKPGDIGELTHCTIRLGGVEPDLPFIANDTGHQMCKLPNADLLSRTHVDVAVTHITVQLSQIGELNVFHDIKTGICQIITPEELTQWLTGAP